MLSFQIDKDNVWEVQELYKRDVGQINISSPISYLMMEVLALIFTPLKSWLLPIFQLLTNSETFFLDSRFTIFEKRLMYPRMAICHAIPRLYLNHLISYLLFNPTFLYPSQNFKINLNKKLFFILF